MKTAKPIDVIIIFLNNFNKSLPGVVAGAVVAAVVVAIVIVYVVVHVVGVVVV